MSAALEQLKGIIGAGWPGLAESILNRHAHELAERQREFAEQEDAHLSTTPASVYVQGIRDGADLIDPEVEA